MDRREFLETSGRSGLYIVLGGSSFVLTGCDGPKIFDPSWVTAEEMKPFPDFREWWEEISTCSGYQGNLDRIHWFHVQEDLIPCTIDGERDYCNGIWKSPHDIYISNRIFTILYSHGPSVESYRVAKKSIQHEMTHDLLNMGLLENGDHHPIFERCGIGV